MKTESAILKRLGPVPFWRGQEKCLDSLRDTYARAMDDARRHLNKIAPNEHPPQR